VIRLRIFAVLAAILAISIVRAAAQQSLETTAPPADSAAVGNKVILVMPFQNTSKAPGLEWIGEAFSEVLGQQIQSPSTFVISREDRLHAFDRVGIPASAQLSRATLLRIAQQMDVDYVVLGSYTYDGNVFSTKAQVLDMRRLHLLPSVAEAGSLLQVIDIQAATSWDVMCQI
jgi:TolB-like protein